MIFANESLDKVVHYLKAMAGMGDANSMSLYYWRTHIIILIIAVIGSTSLPKKVFLELTERVDDKVAEIVKNALTVALYIVCVAFLVGDTYNPFLYFRF